MTQIAHEVLAVLSTLEIEGNNVKITEQLDRKLYLAVNEVLDRIGGKWNRKAKAHVFDTNPTFKIDNVIECGVLDPKVKTGYFPTPPEIVDKMIVLADLDRRHMILEPSAGQGHIADVICSTLKLHPHEIMICENLPENISILRKKEYVVEEFEFLKMAEEFKSNKIEFDRIIMNPPFENQADITHVSRAFDLLADGGRLVSIMALGVTFRQNKKTVDFRDKILAEHSTYLEHLPEGAFKSSGTMVNTIMVVLEK